MGGGIARCLGEIARHYPLGEMVVSTGSTPGSADSDAPLADAIDRIEVPADRLRTPAGLRRWSVRALDLARAHDARFVWAGNVKPAGYPALWIRSRRGTPYGMITYGLDLMILERQIARSRLKRGIAKRLLGNAAVVVAISRFTAAAAGRLLAALGLESLPERVRVVPLGADAARFRPGLPTDRVRRRYGLEQGRWMLTVARLVEHKGLVTGVGVLAALRDEFPDLGYLIAGSGPEQGAIRAEAARLGLEQRVHLLGEVPDSDLPELFNASAVYLGLSRETATQVEGFGLSMIEAAACGVPAVVGRGGGVADTVQDGKTGFVVVPEIAEGVAVVRSVLSDPVLARRLGEAGRAEVERYFNWTRVAADLRRIEAELMSREAPAAR
jgi:phosphatidylinositol alpha-1,6-mannosyltransferase